jgi:hypothetical protein
VNGVAGASVSGASVPAPATTGSGGGGMTQQNLNQIVSKSLSFSLFLSLLQQLFARK